MNLFHTHISPEAIAYVTSTLERGWVSEGPEVAQFEHALKKELHLTNGVAVNSCTSALHLALILAGVEPGDTVLLPAQTFIATGTAIKQCGAYASFCDIDPNTGTVDPDDLKRRLDQDGVKAVIVVHWLGVPCDMTRINEVVAGRYPVIQDAAQALGALWIGYPLPYLSEFCCYSFQATKHLTTGDGGLLCCRDVNAYEKAKRLRWFGMDRWAPPGPLGERTFSVEELGYKYHMNDLAASMGLGNLVGIHDRLYRRRGVASTYISSFFEVPGLKLMKATMGASWYAFPLLVERRDGFVRKMKDHGIPCGVVSSRIDRHMIFGGESDDLPGQDEYSKKFIALPCHEALTASEVDYIIQTVRGGW